jgi:hypothetical protein
MLKLKVAGLVLLLSLGGACLWSAHGAESIRFTSSPGRIALPGGMDTNKEIEKLYESIEKNSSAAEAREGYLMPPTPSVGVVNSRRLQELIEQRRNWIFVTPKMALENMNEQLTGKKNNDFYALDNGNSSLTTKPKTAVERFLNPKENSAGNIDRPRKDEADANHDSYSSLQPASSLGSMTKPGRSDAKTDLQNGNRSIDAVPGRVSPNSIPGILGNFSGTTDPMIGRGLDNLLNNRSTDQAIILQKQAREEIRQWLHPEEAGLPITGPNDPINMFPDLTRREMQPVTAKTVEDFASSKKLNPYAPGQDATSMYLRSGLMDDYVERSGGQSSLTPAVVAPSSSAYVAPQPSTLEIPKRKF